MRSNSDILTVIFDESRVTNDLSAAGLTIGARYVAAVGARGGIGVAATLGVTVDAASVGHLNLDRIGDRVIANALVNSEVNYAAPLSGYGDIFETVDLARYGRIVMIGYFGSLVRKFEARSIAVSVFDLVQAAPPVLPIGRQAEYLQQADCVIATSTTLANGTLAEVIGNTPLGADVYMLGPSTPMHDAFFEYPQVKGLFGSVFEPNDTHTLSIIARGGSTGQFARRMRKVYRLRGR